jgi:acyl-CoA synthetase (AMP-forming)/AMP-acid ligase II
MNRVNPALFSAVFTAWVREAWPERPDLIAIDGKTLRRSHDRGEDRAPLHLVSAFATTSRLVLGQEAVPDKRSELSAIPVLLERLGEGPVLLQLFVRGNPFRASAGSGEVVGRSPAMMTGYHGQGALTRQAEWHDAQGRRYIRTGDVGRFDEDGFLILHDRRKDMVISGGFNIYPSDLEAVLRRHPQVADAAVVGVQSARWGETPVGFVVTVPGAAQDGAGPDARAESIRTWANDQLGKTQRLAAVRIVAELPRNAIGKVLKRELRARWEAQPGSAD